MSNSVLVDNDVIIKSCCFSSARELFEKIKRNDCNAFKLGLAKYVVARYFQKSKNCANVVAASCLADKILKSVADLEPTEEELRVAASLEESALKMGVPLDSGESQLIAVLIERDARLMLTGDKRAIMAAHAVFQEQAPSRSVAGKFACLEQLVGTLIHELGVNEMANRICAEPKADRAMAICFSCASGHRSDESVAANLESYLNNLRENSGDLLVPSDSLSPVIT